MKPKILVIGAGAIGGFYGALLATQGADVSVVCRNDYHAVKKNGFAINSDELGSWKFVPTLVVNQPKDYLGEADYILLCTKVVADINRVALIKQTVKSQTAIVCIQNGIGIEQELQTAFPENELISGLAFICCNRLQPGVIHHQAYGRLTLGNMSESITQKTKRLRDLFTQSGIDCEATENIATARWQKSVWNAPFNPLSVLSGGLLTLDILQTQEIFVRKIMQEVCTIAAANGHPLAADIIEQNIQSTYLMPPYKTSMLVDYEMKRPMETEAILGNIVRISQRLEINSPNLNSIYALMKLKELRISMFKAKL